MALLIRLLGEKSITDGPQWARDYWTALHPT
jgi:hypothetical protein